MKSLYKSDFELYKWVCQEVGIKCIRFAIPDFRDPDKMIAPLAIDGDRAKFLIRQKVYRAKYRPRPVRDPKTGQLVRYVTHPIEEPPHDHGLAKAVKQQVTRRWPYGVTKDRVHGRQIVYNPTAAGKGYQPSSILP